MTGWIIFIAAAAVLILLLTRSVAARFSYDEDGLWLKINWLFFTIVKYPAAKKKIKRRDKKAKKLVKTAAKSSESSDGEKGMSDTPDSSGKKGRSDEQGSGKAEKTGNEKKLSLGDILELAKLVMNSLKKPLRKLIHRTRIYHLSINIVCGGEDAAKAAMNFGRTNIAVGNALGFLDTFFTLKTPDDIHIDVNFCEEGTKASVYFLAKLTPLAALAFAFTLLGRAFRYYRKSPGAAKAVGKLRR